jgi:hypothetical protein
MRPTKPPDSLRRFNTSTNRPMRFCRKPILSTSNAMINTWYCNSFRLETRSSYICRKSVLQGPIGSSAHFTMDLTLSLIQVDIGGHPPIPWARKTIFHLGSFLTVFRVPNFWIRFEALNDVFWGFRVHATIEDTNLDQSKIVLLG